MNKATARKAVLIEIADVLNDKFSEDLAETFKKIFDIDIETMASLFNSGKVTLRKDGEDFTPEQVLFCIAYEAAYLKAMLRVKEMFGE